MAWLMYKGEEGDFETGLADQNIYTRLYHSLGLS